MPAIPKPNVLKTGDTAPLALWFMLLLASGTAISVPVRRKLFQR